MTTDEKMMRRCLQLAKKGRGFVSPNPMVGAVITHNGKIIGEGFHKLYGHEHAEVNAIRSVKDRSLLPESTLYVSLEPCSHHGKTPPCSELIVSQKIPRVVIAGVDPNPKVSGRGIAILQKAGIEVTCGILRQEAEALNAGFFVNQLERRPYIVLKWAQSKDGFIDKIRTEGDGLVPEKLSGTLTQSLVHRKRTLLQGIMVGTNTAILDNPQLTARKWYGKNPTRIVIDRSGKISKQASIFNNTAPVIVFTETPNYPIEKEHVTVVPITFDTNSIQQILNHLYQKGIYSILVEGGSQLLSSFISLNLWDEAFIEITQKQLTHGVAAPHIAHSAPNLKQYANSIELHLKNKIT